MLKNAQAAVPRKVDMARSVEQAFATKNYAANLLINGWWLSGWGSGSPHFSGLR